MLVLVASCSLESVREGAARPDVGSSQLARDGFARRLALFAPQPLCRVNRHQAAARAG